MTGIDNNDPSKRLSTVFASLAQILQTRKVIDFTLTRTTLEQVFVNFAKFQVGGDSSGVPQEPGTQGGRPMGMMQQPSGMQQPMGMQQQPMEMQQQMGVQMVMQQPMGYYQQPMGMQQQPQLLQGVHAG